MLLQLLKMICFPGAFGAKALKCYAKLFLLTLCFILLTLTFCFEFLTTAKATITTNSFLGYSRYSFPNTSQNFRTPCEFQNVSLEIRNDKLSQYPFQRQKARCFPACIIFGVSKCGTRALLEYLTLHPHIVAPNSEVNYFCNKSLHERGISWYIQQMPLSEPQQITVEKSPDYFECLDCADLIFAANNKVKLILLLRDPVERLVSQYMQFADKNPGLPILEEWVINQETQRINNKLPSVMAGAYSEHLSHWLRVFPRHQIHIIESDNLRVNPLEEMKQVEKFLDLKPFFAPDDFYFNSSRGFYCTRRRSTGKTKCLGKSKGRHHITVDTSILDKLRQFYRPYNDKLSQLLGFRYTWS